MNSDIEYITGVGGRTDKLSFLFGKFLAVPLIANMWMYGKVEYPIKAT